MSSPKAMNRVLNDTSHAIQTVVPKEGGSAKTDATTKNVVTVEADTTTGIETTVATAKVIMTTEIDVTIVADTTDRIVARDDAATIDETVLIIADATVVIEGIVEKVVTDKIEAIGETVATEEAIATKADRGRASAVVAKTAARAANDALAKIGVEKIVVVMVAENAVDELTTAVPAKVQTM